MRWASVVALVAVAAGCGGGSAADGITVGGERVPQRRLIAAVEGLCEARRAVPGDLTAARAAFYDRSHETLHTIAAALEPVDRAQAARLLEAKEAVEADLASSPAPPRVESDLDRLAEVTRASLDRLGMESQPCPE